MSLVFLKIHINTESDFTELPKIHFFLRIKKIMIVLLYRIS